jgi:hypothetical protein
MARTTIDIETPILKEIKELQKKEGRSLGQIISQLLSEALGSRKADGKIKHHQLKWTSRPMKPLVNLSDKDAVYRILDRGDS